MFFQGFRKVSAVGPGRGVAPQESLMDIINQKQVGCPVTNVFMIPAQGTSRLRRKIGMGRREGLNLRLLIQAEDKFLLGIQALHTLVVPQNADGLLFEVFGDRMLPVKGAVGLEIDLGQESVNRGVVNLGYNSFRKDLVLEVAIGPALQRKPVVAKADCTPAPRSARLAEGEKRVRLPPRGPSCRASSPRSR